MTNCDAMAVVTMGGSSNLGHQPTAVLKKFETVECQYRYVINVNSYLHHWRCRAGGDKAVKTLLDKREA